MTDLIDETLRGLALHAVDLASFCGAMAYVGIRRGQLKNPPPLMSRDTGEVFYAGLSLLPLFCSSQRLLLVGNSGGPNSTALEKGAETQLLV